MRLPTQAVTLCLGAIVLLAACSGSNPDRTDGTFGTGGAQGGGGGSNSGGKGGGTGLIGSGGSTLGGSSTGTQSNPCTQPDASGDCQLVPSGPACGDGKINQDSEQCDDGNSVPGDGCSGVCTKEAYFDCPTPGEPCVSTIVCGDGILGPGEACDDGNAKDHDGCSSTCNLVEAGYACRTAGQPCIKLHVCGDGTVDDNEGCDDGDTNDGDGCSARCRIEDGYKCTGSPSTCSPTTCGDGKPEGAESCDDGNTTPFDGCSATCRAEPDCKNGACISSCGDGIVLNEDCDDGNVRDGDGCSHDCKVETGYKCNNNAGNCVMSDGHCTMSVAAVFRDFAEHDVTGGHPDFEPPTDNQVAITGLVKTKLDADGKPEFTGLTTGYIHSTSSFAQWYRSSPPTNAQFVGSIVLWDNGAGGFVNRWGKNGEQWTRYSNPTPCINRAGDCANTDLCVVVPGTVCASPCPLSSDPACIVSETLFDGNPVFFPIDNLTGLINEPRVAAQITEPYGDWGAEPGGALHNFHFTTEVHYWFRYDPTISAHLDFTGDDDVWVFVNNTLALDLGGWHTPLDGSVVLDATAATKYGLQSGSVYSIVVFQAERKTVASTFRLTLTGFNLAPSDCSTDCGDGKITAGEECDDGQAKNLGGYNQCSPSCTLGPRCGDGVKQDQYGEACDDGLNNGSYGGCAPNCQLGPHCGDGIVQPEHEQCDDGDGNNNGEYGKCAPGCVLGARCGDGVLNLEYEECDDGNNASSDGCSSACKDEIAVH